ncbi:MAG: CdaR family protein [Kofleriaceae bacterium]
MTAPRRTQTVAVARERGGVLRRVFVEHLGVKVLALVLTATVFLLVGSDEQREITARVGVAYVLPDGKVLVSERIDEVKVTIKGPWRRIKRFDERELDRITLDVTKVRGGELPLTPDMVTVPDGLTVTSITPQSVVVAFENRIEREVDVAASLIGRPELGYAVVASEVSVDPRRVKVRGPEGVIAAMSQVRTQDIAVDGRSRTFQVEATLLPPQWVDIEWKGTVAVAVPITGRWVGAARVLAVGDDIDPAKFALSPATVEVELTGPRDAIDRLLAGGVHPTARLTGTPSVGDLAEVAVDGVPSGVGVVVRPAEVRIAKAPVTRKR